MIRPGDRLRSMASRVCGTNTMERLVDPVIADLQCEHGEAIRRGQVWHSRWIRMAGYAAFWKLAMAISMSVSARATLGWAAADDHAAGRTIVFSLSATA